MKFASFCLFSTLLVCFYGGALAQPPLTLEQVLVKIDQKGASVRSMSARMSQKKWTDVLEEFDQGEQGNFYFLKEKGEVSLRKDITSPQRSILLIHRGTVLFYQPTIKQAQKYHLGQNGDKAEFLLLGFGGKKAKLKKTYRIQLLRREPVESGEIYVLELTPKSKQVSAHFSKILLWVDSNLWVPIQQKLVEPNRDYLLIRFENIKLNDKIARSHFELKLPGDVEVLGN